MDAEPEMSDGVAGTFALFTFILCAAELPQELLAITEIVPPEAPAVRLMLLPEDDPDQPAGNDHA